MTDYQKEIIYKIKNAGWVKSVAKGSSGVGLTLESILGKERENFEIPDYHGIEIKAKYSQKEEKINLFSATPDSYLFEIKRLLEDYGYTCKDFPKYKVLNVTVAGNQKIKITSGYYFRLWVDRKMKQVQLYVYDEKRKCIDTDCSWSFQMLQEKLERKLSLLAFVQASRKWNPLDRCTYFKYDNVTFYKLKGFEDFLNLIELGRIRISFKIGVHKFGKKAGQIYDHGTSFTIEKRFLTNLFQPL